MIRRKIFRTNTLHIRHQLGLNNYPNQLKNRSNRYLIYSASLGIV